MFNRLLRSAASFPCPVWVAPATVTLVALLATGCGSGIVTSIPGASPTLMLSATTLNLGSSFVGAPSSPQIVTVTNSGTSALTITSITISGDFAQTSTGCSSSLAANATCTISLVFTPTAAGTRTGTLTVASNGTGSPQSVALSGTGLASVPVLSLSATALTFGTITTGLSSAPQLVTATNLGVGPLNLSAITASGDYTQTASGCSSSLAARASCQIFVTFSPTATGTRAGTLSVANNTASGTQTVSLTGTGGAPATFAGSSFQVTVQAGTKPITGAAVQLYAAGTSGNGSVPRPLLSAALTSDNNGSVTVPSGYVCPAASSPIFVVSRGGVVSGTATANANIVFMTAVGACNGVMAGAKFVSDEATTVAAVEALVQFYGVGGAVGATASNLVGLTNAFATAATLADPVAGTSPGSTLPGNAVSPAARVNSLANLLNSCAVASSNCSSLYTSTAQGTTLATNTLDAMYFLAKHPTANVGALYSQALASSAYIPALTAAPTDWTTYISYSGGGMNSPSGISVDSTGSVWVSSYYSVASKFSPIGAAVFPNGITGGGLNNSYGLAIDLSDNVWIPNEQPFTSAGIGSVSEFSSAGNSLAGNGYINGGMDYPLAIALDPNGTAWVLDYGNSHLTLLNSSGTPISGTNGYTTSLFAFPVAVALDANHYGWIVNLASTYLTRVAPDGSSFTNYDCCDLASGIALDQFDNAWVANYFGNTVSLVTNAGNVISGSYTGAGSINHPQGIAVDGAGTLWVANYRATYLTELSGATSTSPGASLSPATGIGGDAALLEAYAIALDASGNIWVTNQGNNTITKFIGLAAPVKTPLSALPQLP